MDSHQKECGIIPDITDGLQMAGEGEGMGNDFIIYDRNYLFFSDCMRYISEQNSQLYLWLMNAKQTDFHRVNQVWTTARYMSNNRMLHPVSDLKQTPGFSFIFWTIDPTSCTALTFIMYK